MHINAQVKLIASDGSATYYFSLVNGSVANYVGPSPRPDQINDIAGGILDLLNEFEGS